MRDVAQVRHEGSISIAIAREALELLEVDEAGLERIDRALLRTIVEKFDGGPVGLTTLAASLGEEPDTIEDVYEPFMLQLGFIQRTPRGRTITKLGRAHIGAAAPESEALLSGIWTPVPEGPHEAFVERLLRTIATFAESAGVEKPSVEIELFDSARFVLDRLEPEPGFGMITIYVQRVEDDEPDALIIPIGSIRRIELRKTAEERFGFGFSAPSSPGS